jgi:hypothetical protein
VAIFPGLAEYRTHSQGFLRDIGEKLEIPPLSQL